MLELLPKPSPTRSGQLALALLRAYILLIVFALLLKLAGVLPG